MLDRNNLQICFFWHPLDESEAKPLVEYSFKMLFKAPKLPFSRNISIPIRTVTSKSKAVPDVSFLKGQEGKTVAYVFVGANVVADDQWYNFAKELSRKGFKKIVVIALDRHAFKLTEAYGGENFIRYSEYDDKVREVFIAVMHMLYMYGINKDKVPGRRIRLFLSHTKADTYAVDMVRDFKQYLDGNTTIRNFFDVTDIRPGGNTEKELEKSIGESTFLAFQSDCYAQSYWCQKEVLLAKRQHKPMIIVDMIQECEDRGFPYLENVIRIRVNDNNKTEYIRILVTAIVETIRFQFYQWRYNSVGNEIRLSRPPEFTDVIKASEGKKKEIIYPEPMLFPDELTYLRIAGKPKMKVPHEMLSCLKGKRIGISISDSDDEDMLRVGIEKEQIEQLSKLLAEKIMGAEARLVYGGDFRRDGITTFLLDEARILQNRNKTHDIYYEVNSAWPLYLKRDDSTIQWLAESREIAEVERHKLPKDLSSKTVSEDQYVPPDTILNKYLWSCSFTAMRESMIKKDDARIFAGGKLYGYKSCMPGVLEEFLIAIRNSKPVYLLGSYGGITRKLCEYLLGNGQLPKELTEEWQLENTFELTGVWKEYEKKGNGVPKFEEELKRISIEQVSNCNGLSVEENMTLFNTCFIDEAFYLIEKGMKQCGII